MKLFYKNKGTISVFLTLILLPVLLFGGMTADVCRICMSKVVISDAGEMSMNAGLAQYNETLHDVYGLLAMDRPPKEMESELEKYFNGSLNGMGIRGAEEYKRILDLLEKDFTAINVQGSEIYQTEVEKQQILEYMKYRAPVCLTELVVQKLGELKNTKKMAEAMEAQMDFSEAMEDCQDAFEDARIPLETLDQKINEFPVSDTLKNELDDTEKDYKGIVARCLLMREIIQKYEQRSSDTDIKKLIEQFIDSAEKVDLSALYTSETFNNYIDSMYYKNAISSLGGIDKNNTGSEEQEEFEDIIKKYEEQEKRIEEYPVLLLSTAKNSASLHTERLNIYWNTAKTAEEAAKAAYNRLDELRKKLEKAAEKFSAWDDANEELKNAGKDTGSMENEVKEYRKFFSDGNGKADLEQLEALMNSVQEDQNYFNAWKKILEQERFFGKSIATVPYLEQINYYSTQAAASVTGATARYFSLERAREDYITHYEHTNASNSYSERAIHNDPFYLKLQEYCKAQDESGSSEEEQQANTNLEQSKTAGEEAKKEEGYPSFDWSGVSVQLPSAWLEGGASRATDKLTDLNADGNVKKNKKNVLKKFKESINEATSFLDAVDRIAEKGIENLYIAEYAMQMFSYYTVGVQDGQDKAEGDVISISGYNLKNNPAYRAECEYILWGKQKSQENIRNTVMLIFGIRLLFNSFFAFTDSGIDGIATASAGVIAGAAPYLIPIVKVVVKLGLAGVETSNDVTKMKQGYGVAITKNAKTWSAIPYMGDNTGANAQAVTFDYSEYLRVFLNISMLTGNEEGILGRITDCIQVNEPDVDLLHSYTMISVQAKVSSRTTFMRKISDWSGSGAWGFPDDTYTISYQSILGY